jgi:hypothetical protein
VRPARRSLRRLLARAVAVEGADFIVGSIMIMVRRNEAKDSSQRKRHGWNVVEKRSTACETDLGCLVHALTEICPFKTGLDCFLCCK